MQVLTAVVGGVSSDPTPGSTFMYMPPVLNFVLPPELEMGKSSLVCLTYIDTKYFHSAYSVDAE